MTVRVVTAPAYEPVSLAQAKLWCRIDSDITDQDDVVTQLIQTMREYAENLTGRAFIQRDLQLVTNCYTTLYFDGVSRVGLSLPYPPLVAVSSITYIDTDGATQTLDTADYNVHTWHEPGFVVEDWDATWPSYRREPDAIRVSYTAGYALGAGSPPGADEYRANLPSALKTWMQARIATLYECREQLTFGASGFVIPHNFSDGLLDALIVGQRLF